MGEPDAPLQPGCYYPGCNTLHPPNVKFCNTHSKRMTKEKLVASKKKKAAPKKAAKKKATPSKVRSTSRGTFNQLAAAKAAKEYPKIVWRTEVARIRKELKKGEVSLIELGSPGSAQVTRVRLLRSDFCKGFGITTDGSNIVFEKVSR